MKKIVILSLLMISSCYIHAQDSGFIIHKSDSLQLILSIKKKNSDTKIFYKRLHEQESHEVTAENAESALVPSKWKYISLNLPTTKKKVWAKCYFDGLYKLVKHQSIFYIVGPEKTYLLEEFQKNTRIRKYKGQMTALFSEQVPYEYNNLNYESKALTEPLILYHKKNGIPYTDYNKYVNRVSTTKVFANIAHTKGELTLTSPLKFNIEGYSGGIGIEKSYTFPDFSNRFSFSFGTRFNVYEFNYYAKSILSGNDSYANFNNTIFSVGGQGSGIFQVIKNHKINLSIQVGIEVLKPFGPDTDVRVEKVQGSTVNTSKTDISIYDHTLISLFEELMLKIPQLSKSLALGVGSSFPINAPEDVQNVFSIDRSLNVSIYYQF